ncbi:hypothetical protein A5703_07425 [Mycobacterium sp. E188]|nr:hypothetical protein A5703_07425 [Mycobacterium sp. E188]OBH41093.1 hypothetical protein A5691_19400 [Mycobacterium sp. E183]
MVGAPIEFFTHELFWRGVGNGANSHIGGGQTANVFDTACDAEVGQQGSLLILVVIEVGEHDVSRLDVTVEEALSVGVVQRASYGGDDPYDLINGHSVRVTVGEKLSRVETVDVVHRDPQLAVAFTAVVDTDYVRMPQS